MSNLERMQAEMVTYFSAEKQESLVFVAVGVVAIGVSIYLLATSNAYRGMAYPLIAVALIQIGVGGSVYLRTDAQVAALSEQLARAPAEYRAAELPRMEKVMKSFTLYKIVEIALLAAGIAMTFVFRRSNLLYAVGIGLILQSSLMLVFDLFAERRGDVYIAQIQGLGEPPDGALRSAP